MTVLVIAPHPDDEVLGCGGVMARHVAQGDDVYVLVVTRGAPELFTTEMVEATRDEARAAHRKLGVKKTLFLEFFAPQLDVTPNYEIAQAIGKVIGEVEPELIYLPHRGDIHNDHRAVYMATLVAARPINNCPVRRLLCYETLSETEWAPPFGDDVFIPTVFVDITAHLAAKMEAMSCFNSQLKELPHPRSLQGIEAIARLRGSTVGLFAAEAFMLVREIVF